MDNNPQKEFHALILAGGIGVRLWPKSREKKPKQFLDINQKETFLTKTVKRIEGFFLKENIWILCKPYQKEEIIRLLPDFPQNNIIIEPSPKGTGAATVYGSMIINKKNPFSIVTIFPSDHIITPEKRFLDYVKAGLLWAKEHDVIVIYGIQPDCPETSYGYIETGATIGAMSGLNCMEVRRFHEKPDRRTAKAYYESKRFLWNSGMFSFKTELLKNLIKERHFSIWLPILKIVEEQKETINTYKTLPDDSFDTAFLEKLVDCSGNLMPETTPDLVVFPCDFKWYDMGVWSSYYKFFKKDENGNALIGNAVGLDCKGCLIVSESGGLTTAIGLENMVIIHEGDAVLVCPQKQLDRIRELVEILKKQGLQNFL